MSSVTMLRQDIAECVACGKQVVGEIKVQFDVGSMTRAEGDRATFSGKITGMRVQHDCIGDWTPRTAVDR